MAVEGGAIFGAYLTNHAGDYALDRGALNYGQDMSKMSDMEMSQMNTTTAIIGKLVLAQVQQLRVMHIAIGCVSMVVALWIIFRIWYDNWRASKLQVKLRPRRFEFLYELHPAESFPLLLGFGIVLQQFFFIWIQAAALKTVFVPKCPNTAQVVFPQIFSIGYLHLIFGLEMTIRALRRVPFKPRRKHASFVCTGIAFILLILTWIPVKLRPPLEKCFGDMIWRAVKHSVFGIGITSMLIIMSLLMAGIIALQLRRTVRVDPNERIAGTRMVYYLLLNAVIYIFILPFWSQAVAQSFDKDLTSSRIAEFAIFFSGTAIAFAHLFLRANATRTAIKPGSMPWHAKRRFRLWGRNDLELMTISSPLHLVDSGFRPDEKVSDVYAQYQADQAQAPRFPSSIYPSSIYHKTRNNSTDSTKTRWPLPPAPLTISTGPGSSNGHTRNKSSTYSLFPTPTLTTPIESTPTTDIRLPLATYAPSTPPKTTPTRTASTKSLPKLLIPGSRPQAPVSITDIGEASLPLPAAPWARNPRLGHRRGSSADSSATVQIGIRLSAAPGFAPQAQAQRDLPPMPPLRPVSAVPAPLSGRKGEWEGAGPGPVLEGGSEFAWLDGIEERELKVDEGFILPASTFGQPSAGSRAEGAKSPPGFF
ncbi:hypothetical protein EJ06DRAFT_160116 [Trichodelitschia bisporula]|uniref:Uncharacterized protein n=1 Tax=Trichodelitschia bisporula TaxID=703511 RepID=A0A6G1HLZ3_9PEZI|nr:hypothetical protein EJ06DRAFT_160116 [Trichodelitschia bisporula]